MVEDGAAMAGEGAARGASLALSPLSRPAGRAPAGLLQALWLSLAALAGCAQPDPPARSEGPQPVSVHRVEAEGEASAFSATGTVRLRRETPLAFVADGRLVRLDAREGETVRAGQLLAALDAQALDSDVAAAELAVRQAEEELGRQRRLLAEGWIARARVDQQEAAVGAARAQRDAARFRQRYARIVAPADGVVLRRLAEPGQTLAAGTPVLVLGEFRDGFVLRVPLTGEEVASLRMGQPARVRLAGGGPAELRGQVVEIAGRADERTASFRVEVALPPDPALRSGLIAEARFEPLARDPDAVPRPLSVPASALFAARADEGFVWRLEPERGALVARARMVRLGSVSARGVTVEAGLAPGDRIVARGADRLVEGMEVVPAAAAGGAGAAETAGRPVPAETAGRPVPPETAGRPVPPEADRRS
jgi:RND family efflux transporter MFP subunit